MTLFSAIRRFLFPRPTSKTKPTTRRPYLESLETREMPATLRLPWTNVPGFMATYTKTGYDGVPYEAHGRVSGGNFRGTLNGAPLTGTYCVDINQDIYLDWVYANAARTNDGKVYNRDVKNAGAIAWLLTHFGSEADMPDEQRALQAAIWRTEYGARGDHDGDFFELDGEDNGEYAPGNALVAPIYRKYLNALGSNTAAVSEVSWISPGTNPGVLTPGQALVAASLPALNQRMIDWLWTKYRASARVGGGECTHMVAEALRVNSGVFFDSLRKDFNKPYYSWGTRHTTITYLNGSAFYANGKPIYANSRLEGVLPGDIIQYVRRTPLGLRAVHAAVVAMVGPNGWPTHLFEQNAGGVREVQFMWRNLRVWDGDWINIYRPVERVRPPAGTYEYSIVNNQKNPSKPSKVADKPVGEWNTFRIIMIGDKVTIYLNGELVVDKVPLENYWERGKPLPATGPIELQHHNDPLWFKNIYIKELPD